MNSIKHLLIIILLVNTTALFAGGGDDAGNGGNNYLDKSSVNQYTCLTFAGRESQNGKVERTGVAKSYHYYLDEEMPEPESGKFYVCHDIFRYGEEDSPEIPRLQLVENYFPLFSRFDSRLDVDNNGKKQIDKMIEKDVLNELNISYSSDLFRQFNMGKNSYGFVLRPLLDARTNKIFCPSRSSENVFNRIVTSYTGDTEGLYYSEMELQDLGAPMPVQRASFYVTESNLMKYGFYLRNGMKTLISDSEALDKKTIFFYYPFNDTTDPLVKADRKIVTVKFPGSNTSTKKLGCIYKNKLEK